MAVSFPGRFGIVLRKSERTASSIARLSRWRARAPFMSQDEGLVSFSVASNLRDLQEESRTLRAEGCVPAEDYVLTSSEDGVLGGLPGWLHVTPDSVERHVGSSTPSGPSLDTLCSLAPPGQW